MGVTFILAVNQLNRLNLTDLWRVGGHGDGGAEAEVLVGLQCRLSGPASRHHAGAAVSVQFAERTLSKAVRCVTRMTHLGLIHICTSQVVTCRVVLR